MWKLRQSPWSFWQLAAHLLADLAPAPIQKRCVPREGSVRGPENFTNWARKAKARFNNGGEKPVAHPCTFSAAELYGAVAATHLVSPCSLRCDVITSSYPAYVFSPPLRLGYGCLRGIGRYESLSCDCLLLQHSVLVQGWPFRFLGVL